MKTPRHSLSKWGATIMVLTNIELSSVPRRMSRVLITPEKAAWILANRLHPRQRTLDKSRRDAIASEMMNGTFVLTPISYTKVNGEDWLADAMHRFNAQVKVKMTYTWDVVTYECGSDWSLSNAIYAHLDKGKSRTFMNSLAAVDAHSLYGLTNKQINSITAAAAVIYNSMVYSRHSPTWYSSVEGRLEAFQSWKTEGADYFQLFHKRGHDMRNIPYLQAVCAVGLVTLRYQHDRATEFWSAVAAHDRLPSKSPEMSCYSFLAASKGVTAPVLLAQMIKCWNAYFSKTRVIAKDPEPTPYGLLLGTDFNGVTASPLRYEGRFETSADLKAA